MLKKVVQNSVQNPSETKSYVLGDTQTPPNTPNLTLTQKDVKTIEIPDYKVKGYNNLKNIKGYREKRKALKNQKEYEEFITQVEAALSIFENADKKFDINVLEVIIQLAEDIFISDKKMGQIKKDAVVYVTKRFFNDNDDELVSILLEQLLPKIKKISLYRSNKKRIRRFFLYIGQLVFRFV